MIATYNLCGSAVSCSRCLALLTKSLSSLEGVVNITADKTTDTLTIDYDTGKLDEDGIKDRVRDTGFYKEQLYCIC